MKTGIVHLPLHGGKAPVRLFQRMKKLAAEIALVMIQERWKLLSDYTNIIDRC